MFLGGLVGLLLKSAHKSMARLEKNGCLVMINNQLDSLNNVQVLHNPGVQNSYKFLGDFSSALTLVFCLDRWQKKYNEINFTPTL